MGTFSPESTQTFSSSLQTKRMGDWEEGVIVTRAFPGVSQYPQNSRSMIACMRYVIDLLDLLLEKWFNAPNLRCRGQSLGGPLIVISHLMNIYQLLSKQKWQPLITRSVMLKRMLISIWLYKMPEESAYCQIQTMQILSVEHSKTLRMPGDQHIIRQKLRFTTEITYLYQICFNIH